MNLFRSGEHIRNWVGYDAGTEEGILPLEDLARLFSGNFFQRRLDADYVSRSREYFEEVLSEIAEVAKTRPFWRAEPD
jgi:hypothetical protein